MKYLDEANSYTESGSEVTRSWVKKETGSYCIMVTEYLFGVMKNFGYRGNSFTVL